MRRVLGAQYILDVFSLEARVTNILEYVSRLQSKNNDQNRDITKLQHSVANDLECRIEVREEKIPGDQEIISCWSVK